MTMTFAIRSARIADCDAIGDIHVEGWRETDGGLMPQRLPGRVTGERTGHRRP